LDHSPLIARILSRLAERGLEREDLEAFMRANGMDYSLAYLDVFGDPDDLCIIADYLEVPRTHLLETKIIENAAFLPKYGRAVFGEVYPQYRGRITESEEEAWQAVIERCSFRAEAAANIRSQIIHILDGLAPSPARASSCCYPDECHCVGRCQTTGWMVGPEI